MILIKGDHIKCNHCGKRLWRLKRDLKPGGLLKYSYFKGVDGQGDPHQFIDTRCHSCGEIPTEIKVERGDGRKHRSKTN